MSYYEGYCINTYENLKSRLDSKGYLEQDIRLMGDFTSLGEVKKIYGHLNLDNNELTDLGELIYVQSDVWIHSEESKLKSLNKLEQVGGDLLINGSNISDLGNLKKVNGKVNLRDTNVIGLNNLKYIGGDLYLPKRLEELDLEGIEIKGKIRYWNDKKDIKN